MSTMRSFTAFSHIPKDVISAVVRQMGGWEDFKESAEDVCNCGASAGFGGFIYYTDTTVFYSRNRAGILELVKSYAEDFGQSSVEVVRNFNCVDATEDEVGRSLYGSAKNWDVFVVNALAWFALEEVARSYVDFKGSK